MFHHPFQVLDGNKEKPEMVEMYNEHRDKIMGMQSL